MSTQSSFFSADHNDDPYASSHVGERALNKAIVTAEISRGYEEYFAIFDRFYAEDVETTTDTGEDPVRGKASVFAALLNFLIPLHVMAEVGGLAVSIRETPIPGDAADETQSAWTLELAGASGKTCTINWRTFRKWNGAQVIHEHHYDHKQVGGPLTFDDLSFNTVIPINELRSA